LPGSRALPATMPAPICAATSRGALTAAWTVPGQAPAPEAVHPVDAGGPPVQAFDGLPAVLVTAGFYRTCVIDGVLKHSPAEHVRRPAVPAESPTLGFTHLQGSVLGFVLERELELGAIGDRPALVQVNVLLDDLAHPQIAERPGSGPDRLRCCVFP